MADNITVTPGAGASVAADDIAGVLHQRVKLALGADGSATDAVGGAGAASAAVQRVILASDDPAVATLAAQNARGALVTVSTDITRPADVVAYAANDALSDSTTAPTTGGFTLANAARAAGKGGIIKDLMVVSSAPTGGLAGEIWVFDTAVTNINDNTAFAISDAEVKTLTAVIPFTTVAGANNSHAVAPADVAFTTVDSANLRFLVKIKSSYTPISGEVLTVRAKILQLD